MPLRPAPGRQEQMDVCEFEASPVLEQVLYQPGLEKTITGKQIFTREIKNFKRGPVDTIDSERLQKQKTMYDGK